MEENQGTGSIVCGTVGLVTSIVSWVVCGWMGLIGLVLGIVGLVMPASNFGKKVPALLSVIIGGIGGLFWLIMLSIMAGA